MPKRSIFLIDGFNLYHAFADKPELAKYKWLDLFTLAHSFISRNERIVGIYYFSALATWMPEKVARHRIYIRALERRQINVVLGEFKRKDRRCLICNRWYLSHEEKRTDVNIATHLFRLGIEDAFDKAFIVSGDSDLIPAIQSFRLTFPTKQVGVIIPYQRIANQLRDTCDFYIKMKRLHLDQSLFPDEIDLGNGQKLICPPSWK